MAKPRRISDIKPLFTNLAQTNQYQVTFGGLSRELQAYLLKRGVDPIFTGDSVNLVEDQVSSAYVSVPFTVSGYTDSRINDLSFYGTPKFKLLVPVQKNNVDYGIITEINLVYTAYTIQNVDYVDYSDGTTIFFLQSSGLTADWMVQEPLVKDELLLGVIAQAEVQSNIFIERGKNSAYERIQRIGEVDNLGDLTKYGYYFFNVT